MHKNKAFTLLELLVVIGIIGVLLAFVTVGFSSAQKQGRDSRRKQDLASIQNAMEQYYAANNFVYPKTTNCTSPTCTAIATYFTGGSVPRDPLSTAQEYAFTVNALGTSYSVTATLEKGGVASVSNLQ